MNIHFTTKNVKLGGPLKAFTENHLKNIEKIAGDIIECEVIVGDEKLKFRTEISLKTRLNSFYAENSDKILKQALRRTLDSLKIQAKKFKEKLKEEKKRINQKDMFANYIPPTEIVQSETRGRNAILISDSYSRKPLTVEEAVFFLKESKENAYMFINSESNRMACIFFNSENNISLIEPEF